MADSLDKLDKPEKFRPDPITGRIIYDADEVEFMTAMDRYKREKHRPFPRWHEVLRVLKDLGYRKG